VPYLVSPEHAWFDVLPSGLAMLLVQIDLDALLALPLPAAAEKDPEEFAPLAGWQLLPRMTMTVVDGPDDFGFLVAVQPTQSDEQAIWIDAAVRHGGATVLFTRPPGTEDLDSDRIRGGFVRIVASEIGEAP
jgi:hypothetical protein